MLDTLRRVDRRDQRSASCHGQECELCTTCGFRGEVLPPTWIPLDVSQEPTLPVPEPAPPLPKPVHPRPPHQDQPTMCATLREKPMACVGLSLFMMLILAMGGIAVIFGRVIQVNVWCSYSGGGNLYDISKQNQSAYELAFPRICRFPTQARCLEAVSFPSVERYCGWSEEACSTAADCAAGKQCLCPERGGSEDGSTCDKRICKAESTPSCQADVANHTFEAVCAPPEV